MWGMGAFLGEPLLDSADWAMGPAERALFLFILSRFKPECSLEIGTHKGGSLGVIAAHSRHAYSIDQDPAHRDELALAFPQVTFLTAASSQMIPVALEDMEARGRDLQFVLVDGDHTSGGVRQDIELLLRYRPRKPLIIMLHDTYNPEVRAGCMTAAWDSSPHVQFVELDLMGGRVHKEGAYQGELWGGFGFALMLPGKRETPLRVSASEQESFERLVSTLPKRSSTG